MARMKPPNIPETPPPVLRTDEIAALRKVTAETSFDDRRDRAIIELLYSSGIGRAELVGPQLKRLACGSARDVVRVATDI